MQSQGVRHGATLVQAIESADHDKEHSACPQPHRRSGTATTTPTRTSSSTCSTARSTAGDDRDDPTVDDGASPATSRTAIASHEWLKQKLDAGDYHARLHAEATAIRTAASARGGR